MPFKLKRFVPLAVERNNLYDDIGRIKTIKSAYADQRGEIDYAWNGKLPLMTTWQGSVVGTVEYSWGTFDRLIGVAVNGTQAFSYTYTPEGEIETANSLTLHRTGIGILDQVSLGSIDTLYTANSFGEIIGANNTTASGPLISLNYQRDKLGRISSISSSDSTRTVTTHEYAYDAIGQLLEERINGQSIFTYSYDRNGNRRSNSGNEVYDEQDRLVSDSNWTYKYELNGYLAKKDNISDHSYFQYEYDNFGNLRKAEQFSSTDNVLNSVEYLVDGENRRIGTKLNGAVTQRLLYLDNLRPVASLDQNGNIDSIFIYASKSNSPDVIIKQGINYRIVSDHLGSPLYVVNASTGEVVQEMTYDVWGKVLTDTNPGFQPFGFAGGLYDRVTGLVRFGARDYDPGAGRWTDKDPIRFEGGQANFYVYVGNDPVNWIDIDGLGTMDTGPGPAKTKNITDLPPKICQKAEKTIDKINKKIPIINKFLPGWQPIVIINSPGNPLPGGKPNPTYNQGVGGGISIPIGEKK